MDNLKRYNRQFVDILGVDEADLNGNFTVKDRREWNSIGHMNLITALEEEFDIMLDTEDILEFNTYEKGKQILEKYDVSIA